MTDQLLLLLPLLRCPDCHTAPLELTFSPYPDKLPGKLAKTRLADTHLTCPRCGDKYPITYDHIPVMWTHAMREQSHPQTIIAKEEPSISPQKLAAKSSRIQDSIRRIFAFQTGTIHPTRFHLNIGSGQLLGWIKEYNLVSIELDASLENLRKTKRAADALIIYGDVATMPFLDGAFDLVTESAQLHKMQNWQDVVRESSRVCQPNGAILLDDECSQKALAYDKLASLVNSNASSGISLDTLEEILEQADYPLHLFFSPGANLDTTTMPALKNAVLNLLSLRNPFDPHYGTFTAIAMKSDTPLVKRK